MHRSNQPRSGFTLVELLVVITIIGILMGLLIPAVNAARETARRGQCGTQIKNLGLAAIQHENTKGRLPGYIENYGEFTGAADPSDPAVTAPVAHSKIGTWAVALLPWLDAQPNYEQWTESRYPITSAGDGELDATPDGYHAYAAPNLAIMQCPSSPVETSAFGKNSYVANTGLAMTFGSGAPTAGELAQFNNRSNGAFVCKVGFVGPDIRLDDFKDGQGNTMLFSENLQAQAWHRPGLAGTAAGAGDPQEARYATGMVFHPGSDQSATPVRLINAGGSVDLLSSAAAMTAANMRNSARPSSAHVDGVNIATADGGTRYLRASIDYQVYQALLTLRGKSSDVAEPEFVLDESSL